MRNILDLRAAFLRGRLMLRKTGLALILALLALLPVIRAQAQIGSTDLTDAQLEQLRSLGLTLATPADRAAARAAGVE